MRSSARATLDVHGAGTLRKSTVALTLVLSFVALAGCGRSENPFELPIMGTGGPGAGKSTVVVKPSEPPIIAHTGPYHTEDGTVEFDASGTVDPDGPDKRLQFLWDFGDEHAEQNTSTLKKVTHTYTEEGAYEAILRVTDRWGVSAMDTIPVTFERPPPPPLPDTTSSPPDTATPPPPDTTTPPPDTTTPPPPPGDCETSATYSSSQAGAWSDAATWGGQGVPGCNDQVTIRHLVQVDQSTEIGRSAGSVDLQVAPGGRLSLNAGVTLSVLGKVRYGGTVRLDAGARFLMKAPSGSVYDMEILSGAPSGTRIEVRGASGNPGVVDLNAGDGVGVLAPTNIGSNGVLDFEWGIFRGGDASRPNRVSLRSGDHFRLVNSRVENSGGILQHVQIAAGSRVTVENTTFVGTTGSESLRLYRWDNPATPGTTVYRHSVFDRRAWIEGADALIDGCFFADGTLTDAGATVYPRVIKNSLIHRGNQDWMQITGDYIDNVHVETTSHHNPHGILVSNKSTGATIRGNIFKYTGTGSEGDMISPRIGNNGRAIHLNVTQNLVLPNGNGSGPSGTLISLLGAPGWTASVERNTYVVRGSAGGLAIAETYTGHAGMVTTANSNLAVGMQGSGSVIHQLSTPVSNYVTEARNNGFWGLSTPYAAAASAFASPPGAGDVSADPEFVDESRDLAAYDALLGGPGTIAHLMQMVARMNDAGFNPAYEPSAIRAWIMDGWRPQNAAFRGAGRNGVDIGAVPF